jgi:hypothetical protein
MNYDDLKKIGYRQQPDGSWGRPARRAAQQIRPPTPPRSPAKSTDPVVARLPDALTQHHAWPALVEAAPAEVGGQGRVVVRITRRSSRLLDVDNGHGGCKQVIDQLRYAGLIPNDDPASVDIIFRQEKAPKKDQGTQIELIWQ